MFTGNYFVFDINMQLYNCYKCYFYRRHSHLILLSFFCGVVVVVVSVVVVYDDFTSRLTLGTKLTTFITRDRTHGYRQK